MKLYISVLLIAVCSLQGFSIGNLPELNSRKQQVILLANPTISNIETVRSHVRNRILSVNGKKTIFVGIYHKEQAYDFSRSQKHIEDRDLKDFLLFEITGNLEDNEVYGENGCSADFRELFRNSSGVLFFGGPDIQPGLYGEENTHSVVTDPARHAMETSFLFHLLGSSRNPSHVPFLREKPDYLVTGFCLGMQTMNVATGGTLVQDIPFQVYGKNTSLETVSTERNNLHRNYWQELTDDSLLMYINLHTIQFTAHPFFGKRVKAPEGLHPKVYSSHHQSVETIGSGFDVTAVSPDGKVIEAIAHREFRHVFAVQFHPEVPALYENREEWKFEPTDAPATFHRIIGPESVKFHRKYWDQISIGLRKSWKSKN